MHFHIATISATGTQQATFTISISMEMQLVSISKLHLLQFGIIAVVMATQGPSTIEPHCIQRVFQTFVISAKAEIFQAEWTMHSTWNQTHMDKIHHHSGF